MSLSLRACLGPAPAVMVLAGSFLLSRVYTREVEQNKSQAAPQETRGETIISATAEDRERLHRVAIKQETVDDLLRGRLSLAAAIERFRQLNATALSADDRGRTNETDPDRAVEQVLSFARIETAKEHGYDDRLAELEVEARSMPIERRATH